MKSLVGYEKRFVLYYSTWHVRFVNSNDTQLGVENDGITLYNERTILVRNDLNIEIAKTVFIHELMHAVLCMQGRWCQKKFTNEEVCELVGFTNEFVYEITENVFYEIEKL